MTLQGSIFVLGSIGTFWKHSSVAHITSLLLEWYDCWTVRSFLYLDIIVLTDECGTFKCLKIVSSDFFHFPIMSNKETVCSCHFPSISGLLLLLFSCIYFFIFIVFLSVWSYVCFGIVLHLSYSSLFLLLI